ncbi:MAG: SGNH/GDSL hydrolase family protein, partial [Lysobacterales bacterium]
VMVSIPDWGVTRFAREHDRDPQQVATQIDAFNAAARTIANAHGCIWVDITALSRAAADAPGMLVDDGLHPSAAQYAIWTDAIVACVVPAPALARLRFDAHSA